MMTSSPRTTAPRVVPSGSEDILDAPADHLGAVGIAMHHHFERLGGAAPQRVHAHHVAAPHMRQQRSDRDGLRRDRDIDRAAFDELGVGRLVDQRHDLVRAQALGEHGRENVGLLGVGQRGEDIGAVDVLLEQQLLVGRIAVQHGGALQLLGNAPRALAVALDELDLVLALQFDRRAEDRCCRRRRSPRAAPALPRGASPS